MIGLHVTANILLDPWPSGDDRTTEAGVLTRIGLLPDGMTTGRTAVVLEITLPSGTRILGQTSLALLDAAHAALTIAEQRLGR